MLPSSQSAARPAALATAMTAAVPVRLRRPLGRLASAVLVRSQVLPPGGGLRRRVLRLLGQRAVSAGPTARANARRRLEELHASGDLDASMALAGAVVRIDGHARGLEVLEEAARRHPDAARLRLRASAVAARAGIADRERVHLEVLVGLPWDGSVTADEVVDAALGSRQLPVLDRLVTRLQADPTTDRELVEELTALRNLERAADSPEALDAVIVGLGSTRRARLTAVRWFTARRDPGRLTAVARQVAPADVPLGLARRAAFVLRSGGELTISTGLAARVQSARPDSASARIVEVGQASLEMLATGWEPPPWQPRRYEPRARTVFYLLHNSLPHASAGYATRTHGLLTGLHAHGWEVHGITRLGYPYDQWPATDERTVPAAEVVDGVPYHRLVDRRRSYPKWPLIPYVDDYSGRLEQLAQTHRPAVVHAASNYWNGLAAVTTARRLGLASVYEVRGLWELTRQSREPEYADSELHRLTARMEADAARGADAVLAITYALKQMLVSRGVDEDSIVVLPNGVDTARFVPREPDLALARELGVEGKVVIGYVGSVLDYEGIDSLLQAAARLKTRRDDFHVLVVGDGAAYRECLRQRAELGVEDVVTFTGRVPHEEVERYYSLVDIAPFPRKPLPVCEAVSPLKPFEAMAMRKVPVVSSVAALTEIVRDDDTGLVFAKGDVEHLTAVLDRLVGDAELRARLAQRARAWVLQERDWSRLVLRLEELYATVEERLAATAQAR
jgi:glycosyltransferase involved in cell wall biosynthesis